MNLWDFRTIGLVATLGLGILVSAEAKSEQKSADAEVQTLANFPALQRLGAKSDAKSLRRYLARVASAYRQAGYGAYAQALPRARSLIALFGAPEKAKTRGTLKNVRSTLRHLQSALAKNRRIALPDIAGERIPDYYGIAAAFNRNADRALKNLATGKNVANFLRTKIGSAWITNVNGSEFTLAGSLTMSSSGTNTYSGATIVTGDTLNWSTGSFEYVESLASGAALHLDSGFTMVGSSGTTFTFDQRVAFPPGVEIPADFDGGYEILSEQTINGVVVPAGSLIFTVGDSFMVPEGAILIPGWTLTFGTSPTPTPTPSPTPAE